MENLSILNSPFASCMKWFFSRLAVACTAKTKYAFKMHNVSLFDRLNRNSAFNELYWTQHSQTVQASIGEADTMARRGHIWFFFYVVIIHADWNYERVSLRKAATVWLPSLLLGNDQSRRQSLFQPPLVIVSILFSCFFLVVPQAKQTMNKLDKATD